MPRTLVVCFSRTGHTQAIGEQIAKSLAADFELISERRSRLGLVGYLRSALEASRLKVPPIEPPRFDPAGYDQVVIGTPIWNGALSSPVRSYLRAHRGAFKSVAYFCTCGGRGDAHVFAQMTELTELAPQATLTIKAAELAAPDLPQRIEAFTSKLGKERARAA